tara:strand:- start:3690 stop:5774 length:2085 start_codon:yes stop_codon:yes gene_type:complete
MEPVTEVEIQEIVREAIQDAVDFLEQDISIERLKAARYMAGETDIGHEEGRSKVVATKVRDVVRGVKPSIMRVLMSTSKPVEYMPKSQEDIPLAEQITSYVHSEFERLNGYNILNEVIEDALVKKGGYIKAYYKRYPQSKIFTYTDLSDEELALLTDDDEVTILEQETTASMTIDEFGIEIEVPSHDVTVSRTTEKGELCIEAIPPEELYVNREARTFQDAYIVCHKTEMRVGDVIAMGFDPDQVIALASTDEGSSFTQVEKNYRHGFAGTESDEHVLDPSMKTIEISEAYMRIDAFGTGVPVLHKLICGGQDYELLDYMPCDEIPFAKLECDPEPHSFFGRSLAEIICDDQDASTAVLRGILDNVALTNSPRLAFKEGSVNIDDLMTSEIGGLVRMRENAGTAIQDLSVPFVAGQTLSALTYMDKMVEQKTGVTQNVALNPDALQSTTKAGVTATVEAAAGQVEVIVRNLATGLKDLFGIILRTIHKNVDEEQMIRLNGIYTPVDPKVWDVDRDIAINVGLGTGKEDEKQKALQSALSLQMQIYQGYGANNGLVSLTNIRNTLTDMLAITGIRNSDRYFAPINPDIEAQLLNLQQQQQLAMAQNKQDPNAAFLQAEQMKTNAKAQTDIAKLSLEAQKAAIEDDRERDKMAQDLFIQGAKIAGQYGANVDVAAIKAEQDKLRTIADVAQTTQAQ